MQCHHDKNFFVKILTQVVRKTSRYLIYQAGLELLLIILMYVHYIEYMRTHIELS